MIMMIEIMRMSMSDKFVVLTLMKTAITNRVIITIQDMNNNENFQRPLVLKESNLQLFSFRTPKK